MDVSENGGTPESSILIGFSIRNHPFGVPSFSETPIYTTPKDSTTVPNPILIVGSDGSTAPNWIQHVAHECIRCGDLYESRSHQC